ncbi:ATP-binding protein [Cytobacillus sp. FJAT-54145]|uniref:histidine kinase n=1 Tax=Cytobacillus spartinae TaxID=3299023 RepID=A0ABW6K634_9BACI
MFFKALTYLKNHTSLLYYLLFFLISLFIFHHYVTLTGSPIWIILFYIFSSISTYLIVSYFRKKEINKRNYESEQRYKRLIDHHPDGIVIHEKGRIVYANSVAVEYLGYSEEEVLGKTLIDFTHPSGHATIIEREKEIYSTDEDIVLNLNEYELIAKDGSSVFVESKAIICQFNDKRCVQLVIRNITEKKKQEEQLKLSEKLAVVGQIAAGIAHEIRNPLTSIKGFIQMMEESAKNPTYYKVIMAEIDRINQVTNDFLILAKPQASNLKVCNVTKILNDVITLMQPEALLHHVICSFNHSNIEHLLLCDKNELKQVFINIIKNSIEATPHGGQISISCKQIDGKLQILIEDTGTGIPKNRLPHIGQPFYTLKEKGTGLGLMTSIKIIEKHQGTFQIESTEGKGTTVTLTFPIDLPSYTAAMGTGK